MLSYCGKPPLKRWHERCLPQATCICNDAILSLTVRVVGIPGLLAKRPKTKKKKKRVSRTERDLLCNHNGRRRVFCGVCDAPPPPPPPAFYARVIFFRVWGAKKGPSFFVPRCSCSLLGKLPRGWVLRVARIM